MTAAPESYPAAFHDGACDNRMAGQTRRSSAKPFAGASATLSTQSRAHGGSSHGVHRICHVTVTPTLGDPLPPLGGLQSSLRSPRPAEGPWQGEGGKRRPGRGVGEGPWLSPALALGLTLEELRLLAARTNQIPSFVLLAPFCLLPPPFSAACSFTVVLTVSHLSHLYPRQQ